MTTVVLAGSSGFLGTALARALRADGVEVRRLVRRGPRTADEYIWDPAGGELDERALDGADAVVNLCGAGVFDRPWTPARRALLLSSRTDPAATLAAVLARRAAQGHRLALVQGSAIGYYGTTTALPRGHVTYSPGGHTESDPPGTDFLADLCRHWEAAARPAIDAGLRVTFVRTAIVLDRRGGAFPLLRLPYLAGLGAVLGTGRQHFPIISLRDWLAAVRHLLDHDDAEGPYNLTIPTATTNAAFAAELTRQLRRPLLMRVPLAPVRALHELPWLREAVAPLADQLFGDQHVLPHRLTADGFAFADPDVERVVAAALAR